MNKIYLSLIAILFAISPSYAQWTTGTDIYNTNTGNVGIGIASPIYKLHVIGDIGINQPYAFKFANNQEIRDNGNGGLSIYSGLSINNVVSNGGYYSINGGNVGIGTTTPGYKLEVSGGTGGRGQMGNGSTGQFYELLPYEIASHNNAGWTGTMMGVRTGGMNNTSTPITQNLAANSSAYQQAWAMTFGTDKSQINGSSLSVWTGDATNPGTAMSELFRIRSDGNVGIGTTNPDQKLTVKGTIHSQEVIVDMNVMPDYVFNPDYHLPALTEIKAYIDQNHHLPEMPSAEQAAKDGLSLGDMNAKLLKKVEELTLYLIEKDEQLKQMDQKQQTALKTQLEINQKLQKQLDGLQSQIKKQ